MVAIGRVYIAASTIYRLSLEDDFATVVVEEVRHVNVEVLVPTSEVKFVKEALGTFIA